MDPVSLFKGLGDETRLRIVHLLSSGPLCVCHVQAALLLPQPKISKQLSYLKKHGLLSSKRRNNWTIYEINSPMPAVLEQSLTALSDDFGEEPYKSDKLRLEKIDTSVACSTGDECC